MDIESVANERIKRLIRLRRRRHRDTERMFLAEGDDLRRAVAAGLPVMEIYRPEVVGGEIPAASTFICSDQALARASYRSDPSAVIGVLETFSRELGGLAAGDPGFVVIAENLEKPGNFGAILRTAEASGADAVIAVGDIDPFNPNVIRASRGAVFTLPFAVSDLTAAITWSRGSKLNIVAATTSGGLAPWSVDMTRATALLVGAEDHGLTPAAVRAADAIVTIPMKGHADSLNVSVSAAMLTYEVTRQRSS